MRLQLHYDVRKVGAVGVAPYLAAFALSIGGGVAASALIAAGVDRTAVRKGAHTLAELIPAAAIIGAGYLVSPDAVVAVLVIAVGALGFSSASFGAYCAWCVCALSLAVT